MADNNEIEIKITLDDGSIVKGLANIEGGVKKVAKETESLGNSVQDTFSGTRVGAFTNKILALNPVVAGVTVAVTALAGSLKLAFEGEKIDQINNQFEILTEQAGIASDVLKNQLVKAADGLVDTEDILKAASQAVVELGRNAQSLPAVFELARKASQVFGGDVIERFDQISSAIANGNARQLKSIGIIIDLNKETDAYAKSLGTTADKMTLAERQQLALNLVLTKGQKAFENINVSASEQANAYDRLKVSLTEVFDTIALAFKKTFGSSISEALNSAAEGVNLFNVRLKEFTGQTVETSEKIKSLKKEVSDLIEAQDRGARFGVDNTERIAALNAEILKLQEVKAAEDQKAASTAAAAAVPPKPTIEAAVPLLDPATVGVFDQIQKGFLGLSLSADALAKKMQASFQAIGTAARNGLGSAVAQSFTAFGNAIAKGQNALSAFGKAFLGAIGGVASNLGQMFILEGIALSFDPFAPPGLGAKLIGAGVGLSIFGGLLGGLAGGGAASGASAGGVSSGTAEPYNDGTAGLNPAAVEEKTTKVNIDVQGTVLNPIQVGQQIAQILNETFDATGTKVMTGVA